MFSSWYRSTYLPFTLALLHFLFFGGFLCQAHAEKTSTDEWNISADKIVHYQDPNSIVAQGNVILSKKERLPPKRSAAASRAVRWADLLGETVEEAKTAAEDVELSSTPVYQTTLTVKADWIVYDVDMESINAKGNVQISSKDGQLFAKEGTLNLVDETGIFFDATILGNEKSLHLEGKKIEKTGLDTYRIDDGWVITCKLEENETPPWSFSSSETDVRQEGYAVLKHAKFNIKNIPVFYTPYLVVPVKTTRQTGFLFPEFSFSENNGFGINVPLFIDISDSADITLYPKHLNNRGFMPGAEFRYVAGAVDKGIFTADYLHDKLSDPSETSYYNTTGYTHDNKNRYWVRGKSDHSFTDWQTRLDIDIVSDQDYLNEFNTGITGFSNTQERYLDAFGRGFQNQSATERENTFNTLRNWDGMWLQVNLLAIDDAHTDASDTDTPLWQLPSIDFSGVVPIETTDFTFGWDSSYIDFWRKDGIGGQRFDVNPTISSPIPLGAYLESRAEIGLRDTFYIIQTYGDAEWDNKDTQNRLYTEFEIDVATTLEKDFYSESSNRTFVHQVRPYVKYGYLADVDQADLPQYDDVDSVDSINLITYGIDNYLNKFIGKTGNIGNLNNYLELKVEQGYNLDDNVTDQPFSDIYSELKWYPLSRTSISYKNTYDVYDSKWNRHFFQGSFTNSRGDRLSLDYSYNDAANIEQINGLFLAHITHNWLLGGEIKHSISYDETAEARGSITYQATCWSVKFETQYTPEDTTYLLTFNLANIGLPLGVGF